MKSVKGITLIALVITIIVLIILAGISINLLLGDNGLLQKAKGSKEVYDISQMKEEILLMLADYNIEKQSVGITLEEYLTKNSVEYEVDGQNVKIKKDGYAFTVNKDTLEIMDEPIKENKYVKISLDKSTVAPGDTLNVTLTLGEDVDITKCKYKLVKTSEAVGEIIAQVTGTQFVVTTPNEKGEYHLYLLVGYKNSEETVQKYVRVLVDVPPTGVTLNKENVTLFAGQTESLTASVLPAGAEQGVTWSTTNSSIATVNQSGEVTAVGGGTVTIKATSNADSTIYGECIITVETLSNIEITTQPTKNKYYSGDLLDITGIVVTANYVSGQSRTIDSSKYTATPANGNQVPSGTTGITISYTEGSNTKTDTAPIQTKDRVYLYKPGDECTDVSGGWDVWKENSDVSYSSGDDYIYAASNGGAHHALTVCTKNSSIDLSNYKTVTFKVKYDYTWYSGWPIKFVVWSNGVIDNNYLVQPSVSDEIREFTINVDNLNVGEIAFTGNGRVYLYSVTLDPKFD